MKFIRALLKLVPVAMLTVLCLTACNNAASPAASASMDKTYMVSSNEYLDGVAWYVNNDVMLVTNTDNTYDLYFKSDYFGTTDPGIKGNKTIIYSGTFTSAASDDGEASHLDLTLETPTRIYMEQHGKAFGRNAISGNVMLDTANWTDAMTTVAFPEGSSDGAKDFLSKYAQSMTFTVENPSLDAEDTTLSYAIVTMSVDSLDITG